jgi:hypothetical protein
MAIEMASRGDGLFLIDIFGHNIIVAKGPCYSPFKLTLSYNINLIGDISFFVCYWPLHAVLVTIVAGGQA